MLDSTHDLGQLKAQLVAEDNRLSDLRNSLKGLGSILNEARKGVLDANDAYQKVKSDIKNSERKLATIKAMIRTEGTLGS